MSIYRGGYLLLYGLLACHGGGRDDRQSAGPDDRCFSASILPYLLIGLPLANLRIILGFFGHDPAFFYGETELLDYITPIIYLNSFGIQDGSLAFTLIPLAMGILFYIIGYFCFIKQQLERNGHFSFGENGSSDPDSRDLFGIWGFGTAAASSLFSYIFGMLIGSAVGF
ncbi:hypothetical protein PO124_18370 [Bacillus licheniformis]|nr:hypothetical protein [Bacillus licheniformis]